MKIKARSITPKFRRAGINFTNKEQEFDVDGKTLKVLESEKMLVVRKVETKEK
ncbi:MAG: HI1506-related protein [Syntrophaceae bacterium]